MPKHLTCRKCKFVFGKIMGSKGPVAQLILYKFRTFRNDVEFAVRLRFRSEKKELDNVREETVSPTHRSSNSPTASSGLQIPFMSLETLDQRYCCQQLSGNASISILPGIKVGFTDEKTIRSERGTFATYIASLRYAYGFSSCTPTQDCFRRFLFAKKLDVSFWAVLRVR